jgi:hypothetical protein
MLIWIDKLKKIFLLTICILLVVATKTLANNNFISISLPHGVNLGIPKVYSVLSNGKKILIDTTVESQLDLANVEMLDSSLPFAANYFLEKKTVSLINIRYYPTLEVTQSETASFTLDDITEIDTYLRQNAEKGYEIQESSILTWHGTELIYLNGLHILRTDFVRASINNGGSRHVTLVRVLAESESFTITLSYTPTLEHFLKPINEKIISTITKN